MSEIFNRDFAEAIEAQGCLADDKLKKRGLILTQGGEPTFVPLDTTRPEWNTAALGEEKLFYARRFARHLQQTLYPGAVVVQCFGKQYPNEPLPRWQLGLYKKRQGGAAWKDLNRIRLDQSDPRPSTPDDARRLIHDLAEELKLPSGHFVQPVFEDLEHSFRTSENPEIARWLPRFSRDTKSFPASELPPELKEEASRFLEPAGWVLPLTHEDGGWKSERWELPDDREIVLIPGDSPAGLRLPLKQLPEDSLISALTVESRDGELIVFMPPLPDLEAFFALARHLESLAEKLNLPPLRLEGYPPPRDENLESISFMSDPGVIEVNLPPADNWREFQSVVLGLFEAAERSGLRGHKYQQSGRLVSTGGGAHIILGGPDLDRNPFILRPDLLGSFLRFFQNHPSLSYLFTGLFIGPSSQAPRVDESVYQAPYELEIVLCELDRMDSPGAAWLMDAMLRNLLLDWNGNTHRAEISVDKFYNQDAPNGRLGLVEFRAFEMTPTPSMHLAANALLRALAAVFSERPCRLALTDWKKALHDRFALPSFLWKDLNDVLAGLNVRGFDFKSEWFQAQLDFRFPIVMTWSTKGIQWTLRQALEPWPVMGDHTGTGRVVDSTTDRLELRASEDPSEKGLFASVNGIRAPMIRLEDGTAIRGVRYRLFDNYWGLQPQVKAHSPLRFLIHEEADGRVLHAFDYLNWKRDGGAYQGLPRTEEEASQRVRQRIVARDDLKDAQRQCKTVETDKDAPFTLDLRRWNSMVDHA